MTTRSRASGDGSPGRPHTRVPPLGRREAAVGGREHRQGRVRASPPPKALVGSHGRSRPRAGVSPGPLLASSGHEEAAGWLLSGAGSEVEVRVQVSLFY